MQHTCIVSAASHTRGRLYYSHLTKATPSTVLHEELASFFFFLRQWLTWNINREGGFVSRRRFFWYEDKGGGEIDLMSYTTSPDESFPTVLYRVYVSRVEKYVTRGKQIGRSKIW